MTAKIWANLPVQDVHRTSAFFSQLGFRPNPLCKDDNGLTSFLYGENDFVVNFFPESTFGEATKGGIADARNGNEVMFTLSADSRAEVDEWPKKIRAAGGTVFAEPMDMQGWMYGCGFVDPDGHRWNVLYCDLAKKSN